MISCRLYPLPTHATWFILIGVKHVYLTNIHVRTYMYVALSLPLPLPLSFSLFFIFFSPSPSFFFLSLSLSLSLSLPLPSILSLSLSLSLSLVGPATRAERVWKYSDCLPTSHPEQHRPGVEQMFHLTPHPWGAKNRRTELHGGRKSCHGF